MAVTGKSTLAEAFQNKLKHVQETYERKFKEERERGAALVHKCSELRTQIGQQKAELTKLQVLNKAERPQFSRLEALSQFPFMTSGRAEGKELSDELVDLRRRFRQRERALLQRLGIPPLIQPGDRVLILTPGRVGTKSLAKTIRASFPDVDSFDAHFFSERMERSLLDRTYFGYSGEEHRAGKLQRLADARQFLREAQAGAGRFYVATVIREPVDHAMALFFLYRQEALNRLSPEELSALTSESALHDLCTEFLTSLPSIIEYQSTWYRDEFFASLGLPATTSVFPEGRPYRISRLESLDLLVIRFEDFETALVPAAEEFFGQRAGLLDKNMTSRKGFAALYRAFREKVALTPELADLAYQQDHVQKSYSPEELSRLRAKWTRSEL